MLTTLHPVLRNIAMMHNSSSVCIQHIFCCYAMAVWRPLKE